MKELIRKGGNTKGVRTQKMICFRCDNDNLLWLDCEQNKGRYLNNLIREDRKKREV